MLNLKHLLKKSYYVSVKLYSGNFSIASSHYKFLKMKVMLIKYGRIFQAAVNPFWNKAGHVYTST